MKQNFASVFLLGGGLQRQHADTHTAGAELPTTTFSPSSLFVADGVFFGTTLILLGGRNQSHNRVNFLLAVEGKHPK